MVIDYVRVFQQPAEYHRPTVTKVDDFDGWQLVQIPYAELQPEVDKAELAKVWGFSFDLSGFGESGLYIDDFSFYSEE
mgnify:CR=1 FL=1